MRNNHSILIIVLLLKNFKNKKTFNLIRDFIQKRKKLKLIKEMLIFVEV